MAFSDRNWVDYDYEYTDGNDLAKMEIMKLTIQW